MTQEEEDSIPFPVHLQVFFFPSPTSTSLLTPFSQKLQTILFASPPKLQACSSTIKDTNFPRKFLYSLN